MGSGSKAYRLSGVEAMKTLLSGRGFGALGCRICPSGSRAPDPSSDLSSIFWLALLEPFVW